GRVGGARPGGQRRPRGRRHRPGQRASRNTAPTSTDARPALDRGQRPPGRPGITFAAAMADVTTSSPARGSTAPAHGLTTSARAPPTAPPAPTSASIAPVLDPNLIVQVRTETPLLPKLAFLLISTASLVGVLFTGRVHGLTGFPLVWRWVAFWSLALPTG